MTDLHPNLEHYVVTTHELVPHHVHISQMANRFEQKPYRSIRDIHVLLVDFWDELRDKM